ncbi:MAG: alanine dehydrogenase, partial [Deinococcota bacterium]|nr:alanine dehydrogenase [Deinococcota bacterium]
MNIGIPKEVKRHEYRVAATPGAVQALVSHGHDVFVETGAGGGSGFSDGDYEARGGVVVASAEEAWSQRLVIKVKEPVKNEYGFLRDDLLLFTFLHLAADRPLTEALLEAGTTAIAYETVQLANGQLPLLTPMSEVAGRMAPQVGAHYLGKFLGGRGVLLGGVPGVLAGEVVILGGGVVGTNAAKIALGLGARVTILDISHARL